MAQEVDKKSGGVVRLTRPDVVPEAFNAVIGFEAWAQSIAFKKPYVEPNPDYIGQMLAIKAITAASPEEAFAQNGVAGLQKILPDTPGATFGPFEITDLYVGASDYETGNPCFVIMTVVMMESGDEVRVTTGATNIQGTLIGLLNNGVWPIRAKVKRGDSKDKGGHYLMFMLPPD